MKRPHIRRLLGIVQISGALALASGCASMSQRRFTVDSSALDYVQFRQAIVTRDSKAPFVKSLELSGSGYLEYSRGRSERVRNDFWQESSSPNLDDLRTDFIVLTQEETVAIYQRLVDAGIFDGYQREKASTNATKLLVLARIHFEKKAISTTKPIYLEIFNELIAKFR